MNSRIIELDEFSPKRLLRSELEESVADRLWREYRSQVSLDYPSPKTDGQWQLTAQGWVGYIPLAPDIGISLRPKVKLGNLFRMLEYAYRLRSFNFLEGSFQSQSLPDFFEQLANVLARRILDRGRKGFYRNYENRDEQLPYLRGRINMTHLMQTAWKVNRQCSFQEHTADIDDNGILAWVMFTIAKSGMCSGRVLPTIRRAYHSLQSFVATQSYQPEDCSNRSYSRLNEDYKPMHMLSRFFLENTGPTHMVGNRQMIPFLVNVASLFELFVAEWLRAHLPPSVRVKPQEHVAIGKSEDLYFRIDLVLYDANSDLAIGVLDTKYKGSNKPSSDDIAQVVAYANAKGCKEAFLIYPKTLPLTLDEMVGNVHVRSLSFALDSDLEEAGQVFLNDLLEDLG
jgi:5-methylcytosine-specific restriction enzyme subunit McrC